MESIILAKEKSTGRELGLMNKEGTGWTDCGVNECTGNGQGSNYHQKIPLSPARGTKGGRGRNPSKLSSHFRKNAAPEVVCALMIRNRSSTAQVRGKAPNQSH